MTLENELQDLFEYALSLKNIGKIIRRAVNEVRRRELEPAPIYDTTFERDMDRQGPGRDITDE